METFNPQNYETLYDQTTDLTLQEYLSNPSFPGSLISPERLSKVFYELEYYMALKRISNCSIFHLEIASETEANSFNILSLKWIFTIVDHRTREVSGLTMLYTFHPDFVRRDVNFDLQVIVPGTNFELENNPFSLLR